MNVRLLLPSVAVLALLAFARPAQASVNLGLGADWIESESNDFNLTLGADSFLARHFSIGGRAGVAFFDDVHHVGIPIDFQLKLHIQRIYFAGLVGPWILFRTGNDVRFHAAFGFGIEAGAIALGLEVGSLSDSVMVGGRLGFRL
jgi:hypothetical protein